MELGAVIISCFGAQVYVHIELDTATHSSLQDMVPVVTLVLMPGDSR